MGYRTNNYGRGQALHGDKTTTGEHGIWYDRVRNKYIAEITMNRKRVYLKRFDDIDEAVAARESKLIELGFHENHGSKH